MNYYSHHCAVYAMTTQHLSEREDLFFRRLRDKYAFMNGRLPVVLGDVAKLVCAKSEAARKAVAAVLREFFVWDDEKGWRLPELDQQISATGNGVATAVATALGGQAAPSAAQAPAFALEVGGPTGDALRKQRSRLLRKYVFAELARRGQVLPGTTTAEASKAAVNALPDRAQAWQAIWSAVNADMAAYEAARGAQAVGAESQVTGHSGHVTGEQGELIEKEVGIARDVTLELACDVAAHTVDFSQAGSGVAAVVPACTLASLETEKPAAAVRHALGAKQQPLAGMLAAVPVTAAAGKYMAVVEVMMAAGLRSVSAGDAELRRLVDSGAPVEAFKEAAAAAALRAKPLAWALARLKGKQEDAAAGSSAVVSESVLTAEQVAYALPPGVTVEQAGQALERMQSLGRIRAGLSLGDVMGSPAAKALLLSVLRRVA